LSKLASWDEMMRPHGQFNEFSIRAQCANIEFQAQNQVIYNLTSPWIMPLVFQFLWLL